MVYTYPDGTITYLAPPDGYAVDFANPTRQYVLAQYLAIGILGSIALCLTLMRSYVRFVVQKTFSWEDVCFIITFVLGWAITALCIRTTANGLIGTHAWEMTLERFMEFGKEMTSFPILYPLVCLFAKMTLLFFYLRLSPDQWFHYSVWAAMFVVAGSQGSLFLAATFPCQPVAKSYDDTIPGTCINKNAVYNWTAITGVINDVMLICIPLPMVYRVRLPTRQKIGLVALFGVGIITIVTSVLRLYYIIQQLNTTDQSWGLGSSGFWAMVEVQLMIACTTLGYIRQFLAHAAPRLLGSQTGESASSRTPVKHSIITIGGGGSGFSRRRKQRHDQFGGDSQYALDTFVEGGKEARHQDDAGSETGILQTRTINVSSEMLRDDIKKT